MHSSALLGAFTALILTSMTGALPAAQAATPTCKLTTATFDDLGNSGGTTRPLPGNGYDYNGIALISDAWRWGTKGPQYQGDNTPDDRPVPHPPDQQVSTIVTHSGTNAIMSIADGFVYYMDSTNYAGGHRYIDPKSLWVAPEYPEKGAWQFRMECQSFKPADNKSKTWNVPALAAGQMYKVVVPADWIHMWRCKSGALGLQQVILDDIEYCLWDFPYAIPIPW